MSYLKTAFPIIMGIALVVGCRTVSEDTDEVLAKIGAEKITKAQFVDFINVLEKDKDKANELLSDEKQVGQRNEILDKLIQIKTLIMFAEAEGLDKDPRVRFTLENSTANVYYQALVESRISDAEPTDAQLRELYREWESMQRTRGITQPLPTYEEAKPNLPAFWKQTQQKKAVESLMEEIKAKFPTTVADEYKALVSDL